MRRRILGKKFLVFEGLFVIFSILYLFFFNMPTPIYPLSGMTIADSDFVFEIENAREVILSIDYNFTHPIILNPETEVTLAPGIYFWKVKNQFKESGINNFTLQSQVSLNLIETEGIYEIVNSGNVDLNITSEEEGFILGVNQIKKIAENQTYEAKQK
jgi:hypothetical protein